VGRGAVKQLCVCAYTCIQTYTYIGLPLTRGREDPSLLCESLVNAKPLYPHCGYAWLCAAKVKCTFQNNRGRGKTDLPPKDTSIQHKLKVIPATGKLLKEEQTL